MISARSPSAAGITWTTLAAPGCENRPTEDRTPSINALPELPRPPLMISAAGFNRLQISASTRPRVRPTSLRIRSEIRSCMVERSISPGSRSGWVNRICRCTDGTETTASRQPWLPQRHGSGRPGITVWPITKPAPTPWDALIWRKSVSPRPALKQSSPTAPRLASLSAMAGTSSRVRPSSTRWWWSGRRRWLARSGLAPPARVS